MLVTYWLQYTEGIIFAPEANNRYREDNVLRTIVLKRMEAEMKRMFTVLVSMAFLVSLAVSPAWSGGDKNQKEIGAPSAPGPGGDAQGNQSD